VPVASSSGLIAAAGAHVDGRRHRRRSACNPHQHPRQQRSLSFDCRRPQASCRLSSGHQQPCLCSASACLPPPRLRHALPPIIYYPITKVPYRPYPRPALLLLLLHLIQLSHTHTHTHAGPVSSPRLALISSRQSACWATGWIAPSQQPASSERSLVSSNQSNQALLTTPTINPPARDRLFDHLSPRCCCSCL
jgi:hypothetical protein